ncbi:hypothetical protein GGR51DRAFT_393843 [Nemania sp. FL0031]|nr:hypothetical protein GGR51DRAFT_393843 [Nemania sp. FL0031]
MAETTATAATAEPTPDQLQLPAPATSAPQTSPLPRVTIRYCTQCKWMLRAAWFAQELLSTFSTSLGEVALQPATGGVFVVEIYSSDPTTSVAGETDPTKPTVQRRHLLWDRKADGGFPEAKELKRRVRDVIEPGRNLGHVDRDYAKPHQPEMDENKGTSGPPRTAPTTSSGAGEQQPVGPRWPQLNKAASSQHAAQGQQTGAGAQSKPPINTDTQTSSQKTPKDLGPHRQKTTGSDGPVYDPRMPGGGVMPVVPPVAASSRSIFHDPPSQAQPSPQKAQEKCEDCQ